LGSTHLSFGVLKFQYCKPDPLFIKIYRHAFLDTDLSVHLFWTSDRPEQNGSALGIRLAQALKDFGLVDHSVWIGKEK